MRRTAPLLPWLPWLLVASSCSSPPKPPPVDESRKRPANTAMAVELQMCRTDVTKARLDAAEYARSARANGALAAQAVQQEQLLHHRAQAAAAAQRNVLVPILFSFGSTQLTLRDQTRARLVEEARTAPLIVLRGRTDGTAESTAESEVARRRAMAVETWLVNAGVERARIRTTWQGTGDHAVDNTTAEGRALNRRVEIEFYRAAPVMANPTSLVALPALRIGEQQQPLP